MTWAAEGTILAKALDRTRWAMVADGLAVALAISLPWSTSATGILAALLLLALIPTLDIATLRRVLLTPAGGLPVLFWVLGFVGMAWADAPMNERIDGLSSFHKLLFIPLLLIQFERSEHGRWVLMGFLASCTVLLVLSWILMAFPKLNWREGNLPGIPAKNYSTQAEFFTINTFIVAAFALCAWRQARRWIAVALAALALGFLANVLYVATSRTALVSVAVLVVVFSLRWLSWKGICGLLVAAMVLGAIAWTTSPYLRHRISTFAVEIDNYRTKNTQSSAGERLEFWKKSLAFMTEAQVLGHGTGSIPGLFRRAVVGDTGASSVPSTNPHNQTFAVGIQLGIAGIAALFAMWIAHLLLFRGGGLTAWIGLVVVTSNIVGSLFNSSLFDFTHGWIYVAAVGMVGGAVLRNERAATASR